MLEQFIYEIQNNNNIKLSIIFICAILVYYLYNNNHSSTNRIDAIKNKTNSLIRGYDEQVDKYSKPYNDKINKIQSIDNELVDLQREKVRLSAMKSLIGNDTIKLGYIQGQLALIYRLEEELTNEKIAVAEKKVKIE